MAYALKIYPDGCTTAGRKYMTEFRWFDLLNINAKIKFGYFSTWEWRQLQLRTSKIRWLILGFILPLQCSLRFRIRENFQFDTWKIVLVYLTLNVHFLPIWLQVHFLFSIWNCRRLLLAIIVRNGGTHPSVGQELQRSDQPNLQLGAFHHDASKKRFPHQRVTCWRH